MSIIIFFNDTATTEIYTLSLHDALPIFGYCAGQGDRTGLLRYATRKLAKAGVWVYIDAAHSSWIKPHVMAKRLIRSGDRKSTRLNSSHVEISYAVFCLKKKKKTQRTVYK